MQPYVFTAHIIVNFTAVVNLFCGQIDGNCGHFRPKRGQSRVDYDSSQATSSNVVMARLALSKPLAGWLLDALAPCQCAVCGMSSRRPIELCQDCEAELPWLGPGCYQCALPLANTDGLCGRCLKTPPAFDGATAACRFAGPVVNFVHGLKFSGQLPLAPVLVELLAQAVADQLLDTGPPQRVIPMPLHWRRRWRRGFNQAELLTRGLLKHALLCDYDLTLDRSSCRRRRWTSPQRGLGEAARRRNLRGAFSCTADLGGQSVAIVDDVLTTGASAHALAGTLKAAGAERVEIWCCARTPPPGQRH